MGPTTIFFTLAEHKNKKCCTFGAKSVTPPQLLHPLLSHRRCRFGAPILSPPNTHTPPLALFRRKHGGGGSGASPLPLRPPASTTPSPRNDSGGFPEPTQQRRPPQAPLLRRKLSFSLLSNTVLPSLSLSLSLSMRG